MRRADFALVRAPFDGRFAMREQQIDEDAA